jgi:hypothetical protein
MTIHDTPAAVPATVRPAPIPAFVNRCPVLAALRCEQSEDRWWVICQLHKTRQTVAGDAAARRYVVWSAWLDPHGVGVGDNGDYGAGPGLTWDQAQRALLTRAGYTHPRPEAYPTRERQEVKAATIVAAGERIDLWAERLGPNNIRLDLCTGNGVGCGQAQLAVDGLTMQLPDDWDATERARVACLISQVAYLAGGR